MLRQRAALVTGSTSGIGLAIAGERAAKGMNVVLSGFGADVSRRAQRGVRDVLSVAQPRKRSVATDRVAQLVAFLRSDAAASIDGTVMPVDGGGTAK
jgi:NAD(P)-dependent dehydrogenase (short-subunit alcohol dehydrogenase family)